MPPLVTVVTPSFNQARFIQQTIDSVLSQDYLNIEYFIADGGSQDETIHILRNYGDRISWTSEQDRGQAHAINKGWKGSKGEILAWLNSDDLYMPGAVTKAVDYLAGNPAVGMVYGDAYHIDVAGGILGPYPTEPFDARRLMETCIISQPATFIRRSVIEDVGYLDETLGFVMDYDLWIRISKNYPLGYLPEPLAQTRLYPETKTLRDRGAVYKETVTMLSRHYGFVPACWICGYAYRTLEPRIQRSGFFPNASFCTRLAALSLWNYLRYNRRMPISEFRGWIAGVRSGLKKFNDLKVGGKNPPGIPSEHSGH